jgi:hypothetical protein
LHNLASINLIKAEYEDARKKFEIALKIAQQIGNRTGEAQTFAQLGIMSSKLDRADEGLRLLALSATILKSVGHADLKQVGPWVDQLAYQLQYTQEQFNVMLREVQEAYDRDWGSGLIEAAFRED